MKKKIALGAVGGIIILLILYAALYFIPFYRPIRIRMLDGFTYEIHADYAKAVKLADKNKAENVKMKDYVLHRPVEEMYINAITNDHVKTLTLSNNLTYVIRLSIHDCDELEEVYIGENTKMIDSGNFHTCPKLSQIVFNEGLEVIEEGGDGMYKTPNLKTVVLPTTIRSVGDDFFSFSGIENIYYQEPVEEINTFNILTDHDIRLYMPASITSIVEGTKPFNKEYMIIVTTSGTYAEEYANANGIRCEIVEHIAYPVQ